MSFVGGMIHGAIDGAGEQGNSNSTLAIGLRIYEQKMANLRARREDMNCIVAERNARARQERANRNALFTALSNSPEELKLCLQDEDQWNAPSSST